MFDRMNFRASRVWALALPLLLATTACEDSINDLLEVDDPDIVTPEQAGGPAAVPATVAGMVGDFQEFFDDWVLYTALFTDEMILAGTFETRIDVDERTVQLDPDNGSLEGDLFLPLHIARESADRNRTAFSQSIDDPAFESVVADLEEGLALASLYGGYVRAFMAEGYCQAVLEPKGMPVTPDQAMEAALARFEEAETAAEEFGLADVANAARVGQGRALLWLGRYVEAATAVSSVPEDFVFFSEYSSNSVGQWNEVHALSWGPAPFVIRWTVGDGTTPNRHNELWPYFTEWEAQNLIVDEPEGFNAQEVGLTVSLQLLYDSPAQPIVLASGWEAQMIQAEAELRGGQPEVAQARVNALLADAASNPMTAVNPSLALGPFDPVDFTGDLQTDLPQLARARSAGLWLTSERQATLRRFAEDDGIDLYPSTTQGDDMSFPIPQQEIDNNPNVSSGC